MIESYDNCAVSYATQQWHRRPGNYVIKKYDQPADLSAYQAISEAQKIAFSAMGFQAVVSLLRLGILERVSKAGGDGINAHDLAEDLGISERAVPQNIDRPWRVWIACVIAIGQTKDKTRPSLCSYI